MFLKCVGFLNKYKNDINPVSINTTSILSLDLTIVSNNEIFFIKIT